MVVYRETIRLSTRKGVEAHDITAHVEDAVRRSGVRQGLASVFTPSSTSAIIANEFEPGLMQADIAAALERLFPEGLRYAHEERWHDGNGHSHVRATFLGQSLTIPVVDAAPALGTWQQVVLLELDNKPRKREVLVTVVGESSAASAVIDVAETARASRGC